MRRSVFSLGVVLIVASLARAGDNGPIAVTLHPAPLPSPALKYRLLPDLRTETAGNAVPLYEEAIGKVGPLVDEAFVRPGGLPYRKWAETSIKDFPREPARKALEPYKEVFDLLDKAGHCARCEGAITPGGPGGSGHFADLLAVRARLRMADGDLVRALGTIQTGLAVAKHDAEHGLFSEIGPDLTDTMLRQLDDFVQQPKAPNLYWALTDLPRPLIDMRKAVQSTRRANYQMFPGIGAAAVDLNAGPLTEAQAEACVNVLLRYVPGRQELRRKVELTRRLLARYDEYKKVLLDQGRPKEKVEAMPHVQVALLAEFDRYERVLDDQMKWYNEPFDQIADRLEGVAKTLKEPTGDQRLLPVYYSEGIDAIWSRARVERKINALRCVEAVRAYAATHDGKLPASLEDVKDLPIPVDPVTGKLFRYTRDRDTATLDAPEVVKERRGAVFDRISYAITIAHP
jgi:hypothetical protein